MDRSMLALYKELLRAAKSSFPGFPKGREYAIATVRAEFKKNRNIQSPDQLAAVIKSGEERLRLLKLSATGSQVTGPSASKTRPPTTPNYTTNSNIYSPSPSLFSSPPPAPPSPSPSFNLPSSSPPPSSPSYSYSPNSSPQASSQYNPPPPPSVSYNSPLSPVSYNPSSPSPSFSSPSYSPPPTPSISSSSPSLSQSFSSPSQWPPRPPMATQNDQTINTYQQLDELFAANYLSPLQQAANRVAPLSASTTNKLSQKISKQQTEGVEYKSDIGFGAQTRAQKHWPSTYLQKLTK